MKNIIKYLFLSLLFIPFGVSADEFDLDCPSEVSSGKEFECKVTIDSSSPITSYYAKVNLTNITFISDSNDVYDDGIISSSSSPSNNLITKLKLKATKNGSISLNGTKINNVSVSGDSEEVTIKKIITSIKVNGGSINFDSNINEYSITLASSSGEFKVTAESEGGVSYKTSTGSNTGTIKLGYGEKGTVTVTSNDDSDVVYKVNITRKDERNDDTSLKSLTVGEEEVEITGSKDYKVEVSNKTKKIKLKATATNDKAKVEGNSEYELAVGENKLEIVVKAENGTESTYNIVVVRRELVDMKGKDNLSSLTVNGVEIKKIETTIFVGVPSDQDKLELEYDLVDDKGKVEYDEDTTLDEGINKIILSVYDSNDDVKKYTLIVIKGTETNIVDNDDDLIISALEDGDVTVQLTSQDEKMVSKEVLNKLNGNKLTYEVLTDNNIILYAITFEGEKFEKYTRDINFDIAFNTKKSILKKDNYYNIRFLNDTVLPDKVEVTLFLKDKYSDNDNLYLYNFDGSKKLNTISDNLRKKNYYSSFDINHFGEYILSDEEVTIKNNSIIFIIIGVVIALGGITTGVIIFLKKRKTGPKKKKVKKNVVETSDEDVTEVTTHDEFTDLIADEFKNKKDE